MPEISRIPKSLVALAFSIASAVPLQLAAAQTPEDSVGELSRQVQELTAIVLELRSEVAASRAETVQLRTDLQRALQSGGRVTLVAERPEIETATQQETEETMQERVRELEESQQLVAARLEEQYQTKVESASRYRTRLSGIVLLNGFFNHGSVDSQEVPKLAATSYGSAQSREALGFSVLQSQLGFETFGPRFAGARVSAGLQFDFFGTSSDVEYGASYGGVRLRTAVARMDWERTSLIVGQDTLFLSPGSPASVASLAYPAFSHAGNLWTWIPQARVEHRFGRAQGAWLVQAGVFGPVRGGSPQPGYGARLAWSNGEETDATTLGVGAYYNREDRGYGRTRDGWAGTLDWKVPLGQRLAISGEFYRGRGIGDLGAAQGRSLVFDGPESDPASSMIGLDATGGWSQLTFRPSPAIEFNLAHGEDQVSGTDLRYFPTYVPPVARNRAEMVNFLYRPRTDLILSLEYRHLATRRIDANVETAGHVNFGIGVLF